MTDLTGHDVIEQAHDNSLWNREPAVLTGSIVGIVGAVGSVLVIGGYVTNAEVDALKAQAGVIVPALFVIIATGQGIVTRLKVYAPRTAARIAVENAKAPAGTPPTLIGPP